MSTDAAPSDRPKRQLVKAACHSCQRRKVKCSGERPSCALCQQRGQICTYDSEAGLTRVEAVRRRNKELVEQNSDYEIVYNALQTTPEPEAFDHLRRLRASPNVESYAKNLRRSRPSARKRGSETMEPYVDESTLSNMSPLSTSAQSQDLQDGKPLQAFNSSTTTDFAGSAQERQLMIDPNLGQQSLYNLIESPGPTLQSLAEVWPFQDSTYFQQETFSHDPASWGGAETHAESSRNAQPQSYPPYNMQLNHSSWTEASSEQTSTRSKEPRRPGTNG